MWSWIEDILDFISGEWRFIYTLKFWAIIVGVALSIAIASQFESERTGWVVAAVFFIIYASIIRAAWDGQEDEEENDD